MHTIFKEIGGKRAVSDIVKIFYQRVLSDSRINHFFDDVDMKLQIGKQRAFLTMVLGGPSKYSGRDLSDAHSDLVRRGLNDFHFDVVVEHLGLSLKEYGADDDQILDIIKFAEGTRNQVLGKCQSRKELNTGIKTTIRGPNIDTETVIL